MGQQQLLLLVLGIVIVGLSVVVGINAFGENQRKSNADAMVTDALRIASDVQAWALKPAAFGGNGGWNASAAAVQYENIGWGTGATYTNVNGAYALSSSAAATGCSFTGSPSNPLYINATSTSTGNTVCVRVSGTNSDDISTDVVYGT